jgi:alkyl hydroperoxide reductase subunit F
MLDSAIKQQLEQVFSRLEATVELVYHPSAHVKQAELVELLEEVASTCPRVVARQAGATSDLPRFALARDGAATGIAFVGVPGGHEFTSLVLAILHADGKGKLPDAGMVARIRRLPGPVRLRTFVSLACENCPDVVQALNLMASLHPDLAHEMIDGELAQDELRALSLQGVPAVMLGDTLVSSGKAGLADLLARLEAALGAAPGAAAPRELGEFDIAIIGGGPAGVSSAIYTARKGLTTALIADRLGGQLQDTKGIENLISVPYTEGPRLSANLGEHLARYDVKLFEHRRVVGVTPGAPIALSLDSGERLRARSLIVATGARWRELGVPGEKEYLGRGVAFCPHCDGPYFKGKDIAVVGGGNSGLEAAIDLSGIVRSVTVLEFLPELKADAVLVAKLRSLPNVRVLANARTTEVTGNGDKVTGLSYEDRGTGTIERLPLDGVFVQIGLVPNSKFIADVVETNRHGEIVIDDKCRTSVPGIYAAGDVTNVPYKQIVIAVGEGAKAGLAAFEDRMVA